MEILIFIFGLFIGSFLNSFIWRYRQGFWRSILSERSVCPRCQHVLGGADLLPLLSFLLLGGRCRYCRRPISWQYPLVELAYAVLALLLYLQLGPTVLFVLGLVILFFMLALAVIDIQDGVLPNGLILILIGLAFVQMIIYQSAPAEWYRTVVAGLIGLGFYLGLWLVTLGRGMGVGDTKLGLALGLLAGWPGVLYAIFLAFVTGSLTMLPLLVFNIKGWKSRVPFGPFMILGFYIVILARPQLEALVNFYLL